MRNDKGKFFGNIPECFYDFVEKYPSIPQLQVVADFCRVDVGRVQRWQRREYFPSGGEALALACFLAFLGYEVNELNQLDEVARDAAYLVGLGCVDAVVMQQAIGYAKSQNLWRYLLHGEGISEDRRGKVSDFVKKKHKLLQPAIKQWHKMVAERFPRPQDRSTGQPHVRPGVSYSPELAAAFGRSVTATTALARILVAANEKDAARQVTSGGRDMHELTELLKHLSS